jgi:hypothetical protein
MTRKSRTALASVTANGAELNAHQASIQECRNCLASAAPARLRAAHFARACRLSETQPWPPTSILRGADHDRS